MATREDFTDDEWFRLRSAPWQAAMGMIEVDPSGVFTSGRELEAVEAELAAAQFDQGLIGLVTRDLLDQDRVVGQDKPEAGPAAAASESAGDEGFADEVIDALTAVSAVLDAKVAAAEAAAFREWLITLATTAGEAGKEGLGGVIGPRVSEDESAYLDRLRRALGKA
jgi:hypothetical protein